MNLEERFARPDVGKSIVANMVMLDEYDQVMATMEYDIQKNAKCYDPVV